MKNLNELEVTKYIKSFGKQPSLNNIDHFLSSYGWTPLGSGSFATVLENPKKTYVLKIFKKYSIYFEYVNFIKENQSNPHLPKISRYVKKIPFGINYLYVRMEKLQPVQNYRKFLPELIYFYYKSMKSDIMSPYDPGGSIINKLMDDVKHEYHALFYKGELDKIFTIIGRKPDNNWIQVVDKLLEYCKKIDLYFLDIHDGNFMQRGNTLIITDPMD